MIFYDLLWTVMPVVYLEYTWCYAKHQLLRSWGYRSLSLSPSLRASPHHQPDLHGDYSLLCTKGVVFKLRCSSNIFQCQFCNQWPSHHGKISTIYFSIWICIHLISFIYLSKICINLSWCVFFLMISWVQQTEKTELFLEWIFDMTEPAP